MPPLTLPTNANHGARRVVFRIDRRGSDRAAWPTPGRRRARVEAVEQTSVLPSGARRRAEGHHATQRGRRRSGGPIEAGGYIPPARSSSDRLYSVVNFGPPSTGPIWFPLIPLIPPRLSLNSKITPNPSSFPASFSGRRPQGAGGGAKGEEGHIGGPGQQAGRAARRRQRRWGRRRRRRWGRRLLRLVPRRVLVEGDEDYALGVRHHGNGAPPAHVVEAHLISLPARRLLDIEVRGIVLGVIICAHMAFWSRHFVSFSFALRACPMVTASGRSVFAVWEEGNLQKRNASGRVQMQHSADQGLKFSILRHCSPAMENSRRMQLTPATHPPPLTFSLRCA